MPQDHDNAIPRTVLMFSGHMIDAPGRASPRFPPDKEPIARDAIDGVLDRLDAGSGDLALCGGACGGDLLFAEACLERGLRLELYIPFEQTTFLVKSVDFAGAHWHDRFFAANSQATLHVMPDELGPAPTDQNSYDRNNLWMLNRAARFGAEKLVFICLWNGQGGDGPGGTATFMTQVRRNTDRVYWLNTTTLWA